MRRVGRPKWSERLAVEDCLPLRIVDLTRRRLLRMQSDPWCTYGWGRDNSEGQIAFRVLRADQVPRAVELVHTVSGGSLSRQIRIQEFVRLTGSACHFGGQRYWFLCPRGCGRRAGVLYLRSGLARFACRKCLDLTYRSCQEHDRRVDAMMKLPPDEFAEAWNSADFKRRFLALDAHMKLGQALTSSSFKRRLLALDALMKINKKLGHEA